MIRPSLALVLILTASPAAAQRPRQYQLRSPDNATQINVDVGDRISYSVSHGGRPLLTASPISLTLGDGRTLGVGTSVRSESRREVRDSVRPVAPVKRSPLHCPVDAGDERAVLLLNTARVPLRDGALEAMEMRLHRAGQAPVLGVLAGTS